MVLLEVAKRKKRIAASASMSGSAITRVEPAYGIDIFRKEDQSGNSLIATYKNAAAMDVLDFTVLHVADFTERFPFADGVFALVTTSLALHNVREEGRRTALKEIARVCAPGGRVVVVDLSGSFKDYKTVL